MLLVKIATTEKERDEMIENLGQRLVNVNPRLSDHSQLHKYRHAIPRHSLLSPAAPTAPPPVCGDFPCKPRIHLNSRHFTDKQGNVKHIDEKVFDIKKKYENRITEMKGELKRMGKQGICINRNDVIQRCNTYTFFNT